MTVTDRLTDDLSNAGAEALGILFALYDAGLLPEVAKTRTAVLRVRVEAITALHKASMPLGVK